MNFTLEDTIAAPASAPGPAARSIVRISGSDAPRLARAVFETDDPAWSGCRFATRFAGRVRLAELAVSFPAAALLWPNRRSYTGEPLVELHLPGSPPLVEATLAALYAAGVRSARPGEFTLRAFLAGRIDLVRAEAVLGVIDAVDHRELDLALRQLAGGLSGRLADVRADLIGLLADLEAGLDFVDEDIEFVSRAEVLRRIERAVGAINDLLEAAHDRWRDAGLQRVVLAGLPNTGKSTLFNALAEENAALVSPIPGTTRDWLAAELSVGGLTVQLIDTAGWESVHDDLGASMQALRAEQLERADLILWCAAADLNDALLADDTRLRAKLGTLLDRTLLVRTKSDLASPNAIAPLSIEDGAASIVSAATGDGLTALRQRLAAELSVERSGARQMVGSTAARGRESLVGARDALDRALNGATAGFGDEVLAAELRVALDALAAILGLVYTDDVLDVIFSRFCIGK